MAACAHSSDTPEERNSPSATEHRVATDDGHQLTVYEKTASSPRGTILLIHGRTWSSAVNFDLPVPGASVMDRFVALGYRVLALDQRGYGKTLRDRSGVHTPDRAVDDIATVIRWSGGQAHLLGYSWGSLIAQLTAQRHPDLLSSLVLYGHPAPADFDWASRPDQPAERRSTTPQAAAEDFIVESHRPVVIQTYARLAPAHDPVRMDWSKVAQLNALDPARITVPTLILHGDQDPYALRSNLDSFEKRVSSSAKKRVVLDNADHAAHLGAIDRFTAVIADFIDRPPN